MMTESHHRSVVASALMMLTRLIFGRLVGRHAGDRDLVRQLLEESLSGRFPGLVRVAFPPHRSADDSSWGRERRGHGDGGHRVLAGPGDTPSLAAHRGCCGDRCDGDVSDLFRGYERVFG